MYQIAAYRMHKIKVESNVRHREKNINDNNYNEHLHSFSILFVSLLHCSVVLVRKGVGF